MQVPSGSHVEEDPQSGDVIITHPLLGQWRHTADPICSKPEYASSLRLQRTMDDPSCQHMPCSCDSLPCNNWIDNAGWMVNNNTHARADGSIKYIGGFSTVMSVPSSPPESHDQTLFYFPGAENTDG